MANKPWPKGKSRKGQLNVGQRGQLNSQAKLTEAQVHTIRRQLEAGMTTYAIAKLHSVSRAAIWMIREKRTWRYLA